MGLVLLSACGSQDLYPVKSYKYFSDDEVHVTVTLKSGHLEKYLCAFPPNTNYETMKSVRVGKVKAEYLLGGTLYYCNAY